MLKVLVLYPEAFNCYSKFCRKLDRIMSNLVEPTVVVNEDHNGLGSQYCSERQLSIEVLEDISSLQNSDLTHAIVFSDGEEFIDEVNKLKASSLKTSIQKIKITRVINIKNDKTFNTKISSSKYEYIGRGSPWGNPYAIGENGDDRDEVLRKYHYDFENEKFLNITKNDMLKLAGKRLGCFCKPEACHGDYIAEFLNSYDDGK
ncbi:DUF4326 domain-containing protein [Vibrio parahaemolyticus]|uniref:DUF4326 domain-containing protein n=1 Tax=Vibrio parahaemolyticus TaxID=670 RepID=UPI00084A3676|nr:hypothetical protein BBM05_11080 [Vibrio parahaemolyticus]